MKFSDLAIETALTLRLVFGFPRSRAEGFLRSVLSLMKVDLEAPDHTTLSRRSQHLDVRFHLIPANEPIHLIVDSSGLSVVGEGEWAAVKHGGRGTCGWKKIHLGVDGSGAIDARVLTDGSTDDAQTGLTLIEAVDSAVSRVTADGAYDTVAIYEAAGTRGATVVVPPTQSAAVSRRRPRANARDQTILRVNKVGRRQWKKESGCHWQARVENAFFRYKSIIGRPASRSTPVGPGNRSCNRVQHPEQNDRAWSTGLVCDRAVRIGGVRAVFRALGFMHQRLWEPPLSDASALLKNVSPKLVRVLRDLVGDLTEEIFDILETQAEMVVEPDGATDDFRGKSESAIAGRLARHRPTLPAVA